MADRDQAVKNVITSAFGHSGQKCSATSLLILEKEVYDDPHFKQVLVDAAASLEVGSAWEYKNRMGPLIHPPSGVLERGLTRLEPGESWALEPKQVGDNPHIWRPGIKWGVKPGSFTHMTELFGPVLGVMRAVDLEAAIALANQTGYGLTAGIESLDTREIAFWKNKIRAGNLYINRSTTGAITLRQPFGGMGKSAVGPAIKAGGPYYVTQFIRVEETGKPPIGPIPEDHPLLSLAQRWERKCRWNQMGAVQEDLTRCVSAIYSYLNHAQTEFKPVRDFFHLRGQDNHLRHLPVGRVGICVHPRDTLFEVIARVAAGLISGCRVVLSLPLDHQGMVNDFLTDPEGRHLLKTVDVRYHSEAQVVDLVAEVDRLRYAADDRVPLQVFTAAAQVGLYIARAPVVMDGKLELLHYFYGQSICHSYHRYGNLGDRGLKRSCYE
jgi:RHH-type proline utilization regulon transcriptional repressor/proline dehydrogenase/delta 1-pyrroline-5-carboxylate dehydrogenase